MTRVVGLDLSLSATGIADVLGVRTLKSRKTGPARLIELRDAVLVSCLAADIVALEGYSMGSHDAHAHALGELSGVVRVALYEKGITYVDIAPSTNKKFATGKGNANKEAMLLAAARKADALGIEITNNNEADAFWLRAAIYQAIGEPLFPMPALNCSAVAKLAIELGAVA